LIPRSDLPRLFAPEAFGRSGPDVFMEVAMGMWDFVKGAGKKIFGGAAEAAEVPKEEALRKEIEDLGLDAKGIDIKVVDDRVELSGTAVSQEVKEKIITAVGNVEGIAKVEDKTPGKDPVFHTVTKGETLSAIAKKTLGNANRYGEIFEANRPMLKHPDKIYPGQVLRIPQA
jgi:nucleoid-associated protein YgaU